MIFSTIFAKVRTFASLFTQLFGSCYCWFVFPLLCVWSVTRMQKVSDCRCRVATDDVAEVMCAEVDPTEPDEEDQDRKYTVACRIIKDHGGTGIREISNPWVARSSPAGRAVVCI